MSARNNIEKWLLADWSTSNNFPVAEEDLKVMTLQPNEENTTEGSLYERPLMEQELRLTKTTASASREEDASQKARDCSPSASSWAPSDDSCVSGGSNVKKMEKYMRHYAKKRNGKKVPLPIHRPNAVVNILKERQDNAFNNRSYHQSRKRKYKETQGGNKSLPDSTKKNLPPTRSFTDTISINKKNILDMKGCFEELFKIIDNMKTESERRTFLTSDNIIISAQTQRLTDDITIDVPAYDNTDAYEESEKSQESNRSDDNVLISNKYNHLLVPIEYQPHNIVDEWVPIGSGKTLIHRDKFIKVNWKSYTIATRTLLLATFPRRILATHSLTGKRSPAFQNKPAKMCLDPKIVSDIIIEITSKFNVKENLVRSAITTKCADECKMLKTRTSNLYKSIQSQENVSPRLNNSYQDTRLVKSESLNIYSQDI